MFSWTIRVNHAAEYLCRIAILNPFQESYFLGERIISFERAEMNHDIKVSSPKQQSNEVSIYIAHICINFHHREHTILLSRGKEEIKERKGLACEQAHLWVGGTVGKGAGYRGQRSWREEWGEEK